MSEQTERMEITSTDLLDAILCERREREQAAFDALRDESDTAHPYAHAVLMGDIRQLTVLEAVIRRASNIPICVKTPSGTAPCIDLLGLSVTHREDGCWMRFQASNGREALIDLNAYAKDRGNITRSAIEQWIEDVRPNATLQEIP